LVAAPGAVYIFGRPNVKENGIISAAGPFTNLIIGYFSLGALIPLAFVHSYLSTGAFVIALINLFIGAFNMIPMMPLDGSKIWKWNKPVYITMAIFLVGPVLLYFTGLIWLIL
jgi:Zn-dependent protease